MKGLARLLLANEAAQVKPYDATAQAAACVRVCDKLRRPLSVLAGVDGYKALIGRALALARVEVPSLGLLQVREDGTLEAQEPVEPQLDTDETNNGDVELVARLLGLLVTFIGEGLTMQLVRDVWPDAPYYGMDMENKP